jgi:probable F420-dependent oxidoreductase
MQFGFPIPNGGAMARVEDILKISAAGEQAGFDILAIPDHVVMPRTIAPNYPYSKSGDATFATISDGTFLEPFALMSYVAARTEKIKLMTSVIVVPYREPMLTAKLASTIDDLSGGRVILGCGVGWMPEEFKAVGSPPFEERGKVTDEYIDIYTELWTKDNPEFNGQYRSFNDLMFAPKPIQKPHIPIWIGGESVPAMRRVVRRGQAWFPSDANPKTPFDTAKRFQNGVNKLYEIAEKEGRLTESINLAFWAISSCGVCEVIKLDDGSRKAFTGNADDIIEDIKAYEKIGVKSILFNFLQDSCEATVDKIEAFAEEIMPYFAKN